MNFINLVINELIKSLKRKSTFIFFIFSIITIIVSCLIVKFKDYSTFSKATDYDFLKYDINFKINYREGVKARAKEKDKEYHQEAIDLYKDVKEKGLENIITGYYKYKAMEDISSTLISLSDVDKEKFPDEYKKRREKIAELKDILYNGTFEDYMDFSITDLEEKYSNGLLEKSFYEYKLKELNMELEYEVGKYTLDYHDWRDTVIGQNNSIDTVLNMKIDMQQMVYMTEERIKKLENDKLVNIYRLKNNLPPCYIDNDYMYNKSGYMRYHFNSFSNSSSMIFIGLLVLILAGTSISEEISKGTIKFLLITPNKRYKVLIAKILSMLIILVLATIIISQISVIVGNIAFGISTNNYLYVTNGEVKVMDTHIYETLQYLLKIPEIIVYMLIGVALSTLTRSTAISTIMPSFLYLIMPFGLKELNSFISLNFLRFLPFRNLDFISQVLRINDYQQPYTTIRDIDLTLNFSIIVTAITIILLLITIFDSFNKKDI